MKIHFALIAALGGFLIVQASVLDIQCTSNDLPQEESYDVLTTEYHGWIRLNDPFYVEQTIHLHAVYNQTHNITYSQICEVNDKDFQLPGFIDPYTLNKIHRSVVTRIRGFLLSDQETVNLIPGRKDPEPTSSDEIETIYPTTVRTTTPEVPTAATPPTKRKSMTAFVTMTNVHSMKKRHPDLRRDLDLEDEDDEVPEAYVPPKKKSYLKFVSSRLTSLYKDRPKNVGAATSEESFKKEVLRQRIYRLEKQRDQVALLFSLKVVYMVQDPSPSCLRLKGIKSSLRCFSMHYEEIADSPDYQTAAHYFQELTNLDAKIAAESKLYYSFDRRGNMDDIES
ncbi:putative X protein [Yushu rhabdovirus]|uniref:X protein n=1 Tax=Yushu rhabdovirus TaxID=3071240 RepID=A0AA48X997_9RHAB|nr:putative X protein [Rhabdoviridae sp.]QXV86587.1 putative X protein [Yushu rhabdovirus]